MNEQEQNEAIVEALGQKYHKPTEAEIKSGSYYQYEPQFTRDLNSMHEVEKILTDHTGYWQWLERIQGGPPLKFSLLHATAAQRAEAFLRTIGKWKD